MKALVVGSSSGIGKACALSLREAGFEVYGAARTMCESDFPQFVADVRFPETIARTMSMIGNIDVLVYSVGIGLASPVEETLREDYIELFDVNFFGLCECVRIALPLINNRGKIIAISSMAGVTNVPYNAFYCASKAAINSYIAGLNMELKQRAITATAVMPSGTQTAFTFKRKKYRSQKYAKDFESSCKKLAKEEQEGSTANEVARTVVNAATSDNPPILLPVTLKGKASFVAEHLLPKKLTNQLSENKFLQ